MAILKPGTLGRVTVNGIELITSSEVCNPMNDILEHSEYIAQVKGIIAQPKDDLPRLVLADWLEEHGQPELAEFIRVQCELAKVDTGKRGWQFIADGSSIDAEHRAVRDDNPHIERLQRREMELWNTPGFADKFTSLTTCVLPDSKKTQFHLGTGYGPLLTVRRGLLIVRRGFVAEVHCRLADWCGGACLWIDRRDDHDGCPHCSGTGRIPGIGESVVAHHPVETVRVTNKAPTETGSGWAWWRHTGLDDTDILPVEVFDRLPDADAVPFAHGERLCFSTREDAFTALSTACLLLARSRGKMKRPDGVLETPHRA